MKNLLIIGLVITAACVNKPQSQKVQASETKPTPQEDSALTVDDAIKEFKDSAQRETTLDTIRIVNRDTLRLTIKMSKENAFRLPKEYQGPAGLDTVWNMRSVIRFEINGKEIAQKTIEKTDFGIDRQIRKYGILMLPEVNGMDETGFSIDYDIDVPFSEEGVEVEVTLQNKKLQYTIL